MCIIVVMHVHDSDSKEFMVCTQFTRVFSGNVFVHIYSSDNKEIFSDKVFVHIYSPAFSHLLRRATSCLVARCLLDNPLLVEVLEPRLFVLAAPHVYSL